MPDNALLTSLVLLPFLGSLATVVLASKSRNLAGGIAGAVALVSHIMAWLLYVPVRDNEVVRAVYQWVPSLGLEVSFRLDGFAWLFALLITGIGVLVVLYARYYMSAEDPVPRFFSFFLAFMGAMLGVVVSGNLILLVVFWELTSIVSFLLIGYWHHNQAARDGARMSLTVTAIGGLALLAGMLVIGHIVGSYDLDRVLASGEAIRSSPLYVPALLLVLLGAMTKSAQFPFHFWLPNAMAAPTPVSAYLHSATMVKAGVFLMARFWPVLSGTPEWFMIVGLAGMASLVFGAYLAMFQQDLKGLLAYSTISHLGLITLLLSLGTFKASLFMAAGIIDHETGTRDLRKLSGLFRYMPITGTLAMVASAAMAGVPLLNGFLSKEMFFAEAVETHADSWLDTVAPYAAVLASALAVTYSIRLIHSIFLGAPPESFPREPHEPPFFMRLPVTLLVIACLVVGIIPGPTIGPYLHIAVVSVLGPATPEYSLAVWHGFNVPLVMSLIALVAGALLYLVIGDYLERSEGPFLLRRIQAQRIFEQVMVTVSWRWARFVENNLGTRRLQPQLRLLVFVVLGGAFLALFGRQIGLAPIGLSGTDWVFTGMWTVGMICAVGAAYQAKFHRLAALALLGATGLVTVMTFVWLSAPDLAITQLVVEIVTTVLILLGLRWLPKRFQELSEPLSPMARLRRLRDLTMAVAAGAGMTLIAYAVMTRPAPDTIADYFLDKAYSEGGGRNVVNVILVDFRGFDTLGEITVLGIVALTVFALLRRFRPAPDTVERPEQQRIQLALDEAHPDRQPGATVADYLFVPSVIMQWMFPVIIVFAIFLLLRGHDSPGGGFAAGVAMAAGFILQYMAAGTIWVEDRLRILPVTWIGGGLLVALATGAGAWLFGKPFLTSYSQYVDLPLIGKIPLATAALFDLGVFSLVVGATVLMLIALAHQSVRRLRASRIEEQS